MNPGAKNAPSFVKIRFLGADLWPKSIRPGESFSIYSIQKVLKHRNVHDGGRTLRKDEEIL